MVTILNASTLEWVHNDREEARVKSSNKLNTLLGGRRETPLSPTTLSRSFLALFRKYQYTYPVTEVQGVGSNLLWHQELWFLNFIVFGNFIIDHVFIDFLSFLCFSCNRMEDIIRLFDLQLPQQSWVEPEDQGTRFPIQSIRRQRRHHRNRRPDHAPTVQTKPKRRRPTRTLDWSDSEILAIRYYVLRFINNVFPTAWFFHFKILWARLRRPFIDFAFVWLFSVFYEFGAAMPEQHTLRAWIRHIERVRQPHQHFHVIDERSSHQRYWIFVIANLIGTHSSLFWFSLGFFHLKNGFHFSQLSPSF